MIVPIIITLIIVGVSFYFYTKNQQVQKKPEQQQESTKVQEKEQPQKPQKQQQQSLKQLQKSLKSHKQEKKKIQHKQIENQFYLNSAMNFQDDITDFSINGTLLAVSYKSKGFKIFDILSVTQEQMKFFYHQFQYDYPTAISISEDNQYLVVAMKEAREISIFQIDSQLKEGNKKIKLLRTFKPNSHSEDISQIYVDSNNQFIVSFAQNNDTNVKIWDFRSGDLLHTLHSGLGQNYYCSFSKNLLLPSGRVPDLKVYKFNTDKNTHYFNKLDKILDLGHPSSIIYSQVNQNEERAFTISKDNVFKIWNIKVQYQLQEEAKLLKEFSQSDYNQYFSEQPNSMFKAADGTFSLTSKKWIYCIANSKEVIILDSQYKLIDRISNILAEGCEINQIKIHQIKNAYILLVGSKQERRISIFKLNSFLK